MPRPRCRLQGRRTLGIAASPSPSGTTGIGERSAGRSVTRGAPGRRQRPTPPRPVPRPRRRSGPGPSPPPRTARARAARSTPHAAKLPNTLPATNHARHRREHHPLHPRSVGAEREPHAELPPPRRHAVGQHAVQSDGHQQRGRRREPGRSASRATSSAGTTSPAAPRPQQPRAPRNTRRPHGVRVRDRSSRQQPDAQRAEVARSDRVHTRRAGGPRPAPPANPSTATATPSPSPMAVLTVLVVTLATPGVDDSFIAAFVAGLTLGKHRARAPSARASTTSARRRDSCSPWSSSSSSAASWRPRRSPTAGCLREGANPTFAGDLGQPHLGPSKARTSCRPCVREPARPRARPGCVRGSATARTRPAPRRCRIRGSRPRWWCRSARPGRRAPAGPPSRADRWAKLRPRRSSFQTTNTSPLRRARRQLSSPGRSSRRPEAKSW